MSTMTATAAQRLGDDCAPILDKALRSALINGRNHITAADLIDATSPDRVSIEHRTIDAMREGYKVRAVESGYVGRIIEIYPSCIRPSTLRVAVEDHGRLQHSDLTPGCLEFPS
jgi:hypothetical protein